MRRIDEHREMHERVDAKLSDQLADHRKPGVRMNEIHLFQRADGVGEVAPEQDGDLGREPARDLCAKRIRDAGDQDAVRPKGGDYPLNLRQWSRGRIHSGAFAG